MAVDDWDVEVFDVVPRSISSANPYTGLPIDPDGVTQSLVTMRLTHRASGKVLERADVFSLPTPDALKKYARDVVAVADANMSVQKSDAGPSPLVGLLDIVPSEPDAPVLTKAQRDEQAFVQAKSSLDAIASRIAVLKDVAPEDAAALDSVVQKQRAVLVEKAAPVIAAIKAELAQP